MEYDDKQGIEPVQTTEPIKVTVTTKSKGILSKAKDVATMINNVAEANINLVKNTIDPNSEFAKLAERRLAVCRACPHLKTNLELVGQKPKRDENKQIVLDENNNPILEGGISMNIDRCGVCGCPIKSKTASKNDACPDKPPRWGKWDKTTMKDSVLDV